MSPLVLWLGRQLINLIALGPAARSRIVPTVLALGLLASLQRALLSVQNYSQQGFSWRVQRVAHDRLLEKAARIDMGYFDDPEWHDRMARANRESGYRPYNLTVVTIGVAGTAVTLIGMVGLLAVLDPILVVLSVERLPNGLDSKVGRLFEAGHDLSGGEWQRMALARLMYRDADVGIVISHRFSTVRIADRIAVVRDGRVTELGTHDELLALGGRYAELFELQAAGYR